MKVPSWTRVEERREPFTAPLERSHRAFYFVGFRVLSKQPHPNVTIFCELFGSLSIISSLACAGGAPMQRFTKLPRFVRTPTMQTPSALVMIHTSTSGA